MSAAAYFDVDGTLVGTSLVHPAAWLLANQATPLLSARRFGRALAGAPAMLLAEMRDRRLFNEMLFSHFVGMTEDRLVALSGEVFEDVIRPRIFAGALDLVEKCRAAGLRVVLVTGSMHQTMLPLAQWLGIDSAADVIANRLEFKDGVATGKLMRPVVAGPEKARLIVEDASAHGHDLARCHAYSDSYSDVPMLSVVGHPHCIRPDKRLRRLALSYDWPILDLEGPAREDRVSVRSEP